MTTRPSSTTQTQHKSTAQTDPNSYAAAADVPPTIQEREFREAWRAVANAKLNEFRRQCWRLAGLVRTGTIHKQSAGRGHAPRPSAVGLTERPTPCRPRKSTGRWQASR